MESPFSRLIHLEYCVACCVACCVGCLDYALTAAFSCQRRDRWLWLELLDYHHQAVAVFGARVKQTKAVVTVMLTMKLLLLVVLKAMALVWAWHNWRLAQVLAVEV